MVLDIHSHLGACLILDRTSLLAIVFFLVLLNLTFENQHYFYFTTFFIAFVLPNLFL